MTIRTDRIERWARGKNLRLFILLTEDGVTWLQRSRRDRWSAMERAAPASVLEIAQRAKLTRDDGEARALETELRAAAEERPIIHDSPYLSIFRTTRKRAEQLAASARGGDEDERERRRSARARDENVYAETN